MTFKVGDKIVCIDPCAGSNIGAGTVCEVVYVDARYYGPGAFFRVRPLSGHGREEGLFSYRFKPYEEAKEPSDKELADEYRRLAFEMKKVRSALVGKGYSLIVGGAQPPKFRKMVTEEI